MIRSSQFWTHWKGLSNTYPTICCFIDPDIIFIHFTEIRLQKMLIDITKIDISYDRVTRSRYNSIAMYGTLNPIECDRFDLNRFRQCRENWATILVTHRHTDTQTHRHTDTQTHRHTDRHLFSFRFWVDRYTWRWVYELFITSSLLEQDYSLSSVRKAKPSEKSIIS